MDSTTIGDRVQARFHRTGDRYAHSVLVRPLDQLVNVLDSIEGTHDEFWPASPPLQQLSMASLPDGRQAALLIGMAGRSHWSLSVAAAEGALCFDVACRSHQRPRFLGSRYRFNAITALAQPGQVQLSLPRGMLQITMEPGLSLLRCSADNSILSIDCDSSSPSVATHRWAYRIQFIERPPVSP